MDPRGMNTVYFLVIVYLVAVAGQMDPDKPLFLSPYIEQGDIKTAQYLSRVGPLPGTCTAITSYSGYITVNKQYNSNIFFWFIPAQERDVKEAPLVLFLDGGPGVSSLFGLFVQTGPYVVTKHKTLQSHLVPTREETRVTGVLGSCGDAVNERKYDWSKKHSMLFVDQPVGTGFSFTDDDAGYAKSQDDIARTMYSFLIQFFTMFPTYQQNDFYMAGESYAGKYISSISHKIHTENPTASRRINMKGLFLGGAFIDPERVFLHYAEFMYQTGMFNAKERDGMNTRMNRVIQLHREGKSMEALTMGAETLFGKGSYVFNASGYTVLDNLLKENDAPEFYYAVPYIELPDTRRSLHVGNNSYFYFGNPKVTPSLVQDFVESAGPYFSTVLNSNQYNIMLFNGQLDIGVLAPGVLAFLDSLSTWPDLQAYRDADKKIWRLKPGDADVAGYVTPVGKFKYAIVREAGHYVPYDQPERGYDLFTKFIENQSF